MSWRFFSQVYKILRNKQSRESFRTFLCSLLDLVFSGNPYVAFQAARKLTILVLVCSTNELLKSLAQSRLAQFHLEILLPFAYYITEKFFMYNVLEIANCLPPKKLLKYGSYLKSKSMNLKLFRKWNFQMINFVLVHTKLLEVFLNTKSMFSDTP